MTRSNRYVVAFVAIVAAASFAVSDSSNVSAAALGVLKPCELLHNADVNAEFGFRFSNEGDRSAMSGRYCLYSGEAPFRGKRYLETLFFQLVAPRTCQFYVRGETPVRDFPTTAWSATSPAKNGGNGLFAFKGRGVCALFSISGPRLTRNCPCMMTHARILRHLERLARVVWARLPA
jgi:hypothetical protein